MIVLLREALTRKQQRAFYVGAFYGAAMFMAFDRLWRWWLS